MKRANSLFHHPRQKIVMPGMKDSQKNRGSELLRQIHPLIIAFLFTGLDFRPKKDEKNLHEYNPSIAYRERVIKIYCVLTYFTSWVFSLMIIYGICKNEENLPVKEYIGYLFVELSLIFFRGVLHLRRKNIAHTLEHLSDAYDEIKYKSKSLKKGVITAFLIGYPGMYMLMYGLLHLSFIAKGPSYYKKFMRRRYNYVISLTLPDYVYYLLGIIDFFLNELNFASVYQFIILFITMSIALSLILEDYCKSINASGATFNAMQKHHISAMNTVQVVDKCVSYPLFVLLGTHIWLLFFLLSFFYWQSKLEHSLSALDIYFYLLFILYVFQYFTVTVFAAKVHEAVQNIKMEVSKMNSSLSQLTAVEQILLMVKINHHSDICLTVWGSINITRNFVFSSFGALLTFGALYLSI
ncbi:uncharacterized protein TNIN_448961 [Trichonephila inaurata madagascariensis]|uniref:Gustatory receptor n=1 Tax=Trichonephila inaurata madagascariensis TaxID=2747483 RepID=A0A8X7CLS1_9ARAC|nr:uncharacterized protein TNIN_448961 [Trichonephila inaurata madagascariensis]